jgi:hypothetical protein
MELDLRTLQDQAIQAMEFLFPNHDIEDELVTSVYPGIPDGPTVGVVRKQLFPELRWLWLDWIQDAKMAGFSIP